MTWNVDALILEGLRCDDLCSVGDVEGGEDFAGCPSLLSICRSGGDAGMCLLRCWVDLLFWCGLRTSCKSRCCCGSGSC